MLYDSDFEAFDKFLHFKKLVSSNHTHESLIQNLNLLYHSFQDSPFRAIVKSIISSTILEARLLSGRASHGRFRTFPSGQTLTLNLKSRTRTDSSLLLEVVDSNTDFKPARGEIICETQSPLQQSDQFSLNVLWLGSRPLYAGRTYQILPLHESASACEGLVGKLKGCFDPETQKLLSASSLKAGDLGQVEIELNQRIPFDRQDKATPFSFLLLTDKFDNRCFGLGIIRFSLRRADNIHWQDLGVSKAERAAAKGQKPFVLWFTGLSGCGKSTVASLLEKKLHQIGKHTYILDGDNIRHGLCRDLGFTEADRVENMRRVTEVARLMVDAGLIVLVTFISPFRAERAKARASFEDGEFVEIFIDTPLEICEARDIKGLYAKARAGLIKNFTGIDSPYEPPERADIHLDGRRLSEEEMANAIFHWLVKKKYI